MRASIARRRAGVRGRRNRHLGFVGVIEQRHELVIVAMRNRVELVRVALGAADRQPEPGRPGRGHAVGHRVEAEFERVDSPFLVEHRVSVKARRHLLRNPGVRQHVAGKLLDRESIKRQIGVQRLDHPIAVRPDRAPAILFVSVRVGVSRQIEPSPRPSLAVMRRRQQPVNLFLVGIGRTVRNERVDLFRRRAAGPPGRVIPCAAAWLDRPRAKASILSDPVAPERTRRSGFAPSAASLTLGNRRAGPASRNAQCTSYFAPSATHCLRICRSLSDSVEFAARRRHPLIRVLGKDPPHQLALIRLARHDRPFARTRRLECSLFLVQPQLRLATLVVRPMAFETMPRKNRPHLVVKIDRTPRRNCLPSSASCTTRKPRKGEPRRQHDPNGPVVIHGSRLQAVGSHGGQGLPARKGRQRRVFTQLYKARRSNTRSPASSPPQPARDRWLRLTPCQVPKTGQNSPQLQSPLEFSSCSRLHPVLLRSAPFASAASQLPLRVASRLRHDKGCSLQLSKPLQRCHRYTNPTRQRGAQANTRDAPRPRSALSSFPPLPRGNAPRRSAAASPTALHFTARSARKNTPKNSIAPGEVKSMPLINSFMAIKDLAFPTGVRGPVDRVAFIPFAAICTSVANQMSPVVGPRLTSLDIP